MKDYSATTSKLLSGMEKLGIPLSAEKASALAQFLDLLHEANKSINLTSIPEQDAVELHLIDSLSAMLARETFQGADPLLIDIGSGAGLPGIPLCLVIEDLHCTFLDSKNKKLDFIKKTCAALHLSKCSFVHGRAEELAHDARYRERFDIVISRAVASLPLLCELTLPYAKVGGRMIAMKGAKYQEELESAKELIQLLGARLERVIEFALPFSESRRALVVLEKVAACGRKYPRNAGVLQRLYRKKTDQT